MHHLSRCNGWVVAALVVASAAVVPYLHGQTVGSAFTYQGRLDDGGAPATGVFDLRFELYDAASGGAAVAPTVYVDDLAVSGGLITQALDFGHSAFDGNPRWLEVALRAAGSSDPYVTLAPRHELTAAPYASFAVAAASAAQVDWSDVTAKPAGFADDLDGDLLSALPCAAGQVPQHTGSGWGCASPGGGGTVTSVAAGQGLQATPSNPITGSGTIAVDSSVVPFVAASNTFTGTQTMQPATTAGRALVVRGASGQTAALQEWQDGSGSTLASVNAAGVFSGDGSGLTNLPSGVGMIVTVAQSGGDFTSIQAALDSIVDASASHRYLVHVAPGVYAETVIMKPYVDIQGSGELTTRITQPGSSSTTGTVWGVSDAELRFLTVESTGGTTYAVALYNAGSPRLTHISAIASGSTYNYGMYNQWASPVLLNVTSTASGGTSSFGMYNSFSYPTITNSFVGASGGSNNYGLYNTATLGVNTMQVNSSHISGSTYTIRNDSEFVVRIVASRLSGGPILLNGGLVTCISVYDESYASPGYTTCP